MTTDQATKLIDRDPSQQIIDKFYSVYNGLEPWFLESVYEGAFAIALADKGLHAVRQAPMTVAFRGRTVGEFRADLLVDDRIIVELKAVSRLTPVDESQLINYLRATGVRVGPLFNFGPQPEFRRRVC